MNSISKMATLTFSLLFIGCSSAPKEATPAPETVPMRSGGSAGPGGSGQPPLGGRREPFCLDTARIEALLLPP